MDKITPLYGDDAIDRFKQLVNEAKSPTPSKEPSVDEILRTLQGAINGSVSWIEDKQGKDEAKAQLLALHLGCLPEKKPTAAPRGKMMPFNESCMNEGFNAAIDLMEQKLRQLYGEN